MSESAELKQMTSAIQQVQMAIARLEVKFDGALSSSTDLKKRLDEDFEPRVRALERRLWSLPSAAVGVSGAALALSVVDWIMRK